jgi:hypothetical protein
MGVAEEVEIDVRGPIDLREGDTFILCSDGLHGVVKEPELREIAKMPIDVAADEFLKRALERGAPDNVTVIVARVEATDDSQPEAPPLIEDDVTLVDRFEDTQPLDSLDPAQFDETLKDTAKLPAVVLPDPVEPSGEPIVESAPATKPASPARAPKRSALKWTLVLAIVIGGAVSAWFYWNHQQAIANEARPASTSSR